MAAANEKEIKLLVKQIEQLTDYPKPSNPLEIKDFNDDPDLLRKALIPPEADSTSFDSVRQQLKLLRDLNVYYFAFDKILQPLRCYICSVQFECVQNYKIHIKCKPHNVCLKSYNNQRDSRRSNRIFLVNRLMGLPSIHLSEEKHKKGGAHSSTSQDFWRQKMAADIHKAGTDLYFCCRICGDAFPGPVQAHIDTPRHQLNALRVVDCKDCKMYFTEAYLLQSHCSTLLHKLIKIRQIKKAIERGRLSDRTGSTTHVSKVVTVSAATTATATTTMTKASAANKKEEQSKPSTKLSENSKQSGIKDGKKVKPKEVVLEDASVDHGKTKESDGKDTTKPSSSSSKLENESKEKKGKEKLEPVAMEFVMPVTGFFCKLCALFYDNSKTNKEKHCSTSQHRTKAAHWYMKNKMPLPPSLKSSKEVQAILTRREKGKKAPEKLGELHQDSTHPSKEEKTGSSATKTSTNDDTCKDTVGKQLTVKNDTENLTSGESDNKGDKLSEGVGLTGDKLNAKRDVRSTLSAEKRAEKMTMNVGSVDEVERNKVAKVRGKQEGKFAEKVATPKTATDRDDSGEIPTGSSGREQEMVTCDASRHAESNGSDRDVTVDVDAGVSQDEFQKDAEMVERESCSDEDSMSDDEEGILEDVEEGDDDDDESQVEPMEEDVDSRDVEKNHSKKGIELEKVDLADNESDAHTLQDPMEMEDTHVDDENQKKQIDAKMVQPVTNSRRTRRRSSANSRRTRSRSAYTRRMLRRVQLRKEREEIIKQKQQKNLPVLLVCGDVFVQHLTKFMKDKILRFDTYQNEFEQHMHSVESKTIAQFMEQELHVIKNLKPDIVLLHLGTFDLDAGLEPCEVSSQLLELVEKLHKELHVERIIVCEILDRDTNHQSNPSFSVKLRQLHNELRPALDGIPYAKFLPFEARAKQKYFDIDLGIVSGKIYGQWSYEVRSEMRKLHQKGYFRDKQANRPSQGGSYVESKETNNVEHQEKRSENSLYGKNLNQDPKDFKNITQSKDKNLAQGFEGSKSVSHSTGKNLEADTKGSKNGSKNRSKTRGKHCDKGSERRQWTTVIAGHSFISNLERSIKSNETLYGENILKHFGVKDCQIHLSGVEGRTVDVFTQHDLNRIEEIQPELLILQLGTWDLANPLCSAEFVATALVDLAEGIYRDYKPGLIYVCEILPRCSPPSYVANFNQKVELCNQFLEAKLKKSRCCFFWKHTEWWQPEHHHYEADGVNWTDDGNLCLYKSYKSAVQKGIQRLSAAGDGEKDKLEGKDSKSDQNEGDAKQLEDIGIKQRETSQKHHAGDGIEEHQTLDGSSQGVMNDFVILDEVGHAGDEEKDEAERKHSKSQDDVGIKQGETAQKDNSVDRIEGHQTMDGYGSGQALMNDFVVLDEVGHAGDEENDKSDRKHSKRKRKQQRETSKKMKTRDVIEGHQTLDGSSQALMNDFVILDEVGHAGDEEKNKSERKHSKSQDGVGIKQGETAPKGNSGDGIEGHQTLDESSQGLINDFVILDEVGHAEDEEREELQSKKDKRIVKNSDNIQDGYVEVDVMNEELEVPDSGDMSEDEELFENVDEMEDTEEIANGGDESMDVEDSGNDVHSNPSSGTGTDESLSRLGDEHIVMESIEEEEEVDIEGVDEELSHGEGLQNSEVMLDAEKEGEGNVVTEMMAIPKGDEQNTDDDANIEMAKYSDNDKMLKKNQKDLQELGKSSKQNIGYVSDLRKDNIPQSENANVASQHNAAQSEINTTTSGDDEIQPKQTTSHYPSIQPKKGEDVTQSGAAANKEDVSKKHNSSIENKTNKTISSSKNSHSKDNKKQNSRVSEGERVRRADNIFESFVAGGLLRKGGHSNVTVGKEMNIFNLFAKSKDDDDSKSNQIDDIVADSDKHGSDSKSSPTDVDKQIGDSGNLSANNNKSKNNVSLASKEMAEERSDSVDSSKDNDGPKQGEGTSNQEVLEGSNIDLSACAIQTGEDTDAHSKEMVEESDKTAESDERDETTDRLELLEGSNTDISAGVIQTEEDKDAHSKEMMEESNKTAESDERDEPTDRLELLQGSNTDMSASVIQTEEDTDAHSKEIMEESDKTAESAERDEPTDRQELAKASSVDSCADVAQSEESKDSHSEEQMEKGDGGADESEGSKSKVIEETEVKSTTSEIQRSDKAENGNHDKEQRLGSANSNPDGSVPRPPTQIDSTSSQKIVQETNIADSSAGGIQTQETESGDSNEMSTQKDNSSNSFEVQNIPKMDSQSSVQEGSHTIDSHIGVTQAEDSEGVRSTSIGEQEDTATTSGESNNSQSATRQVVGESRQSTAEISKDGNETESSPTTSNKELTDGQPQSSETESSLTTSNKDLTDGQPQGSETESSSTTSNKDLTDGQPQSSETESSSTPSNKESTDGQPHSISIGEQAYKIVIAGHSTVCQLETFVDGLREVGINEGFDFDTTKVELRGDESKTIANFLEKDLSYVRELKPDIVILQLGAVDLTELSKSPEKVASNLVTLIQKLHYDLSVKLIVLGQTLPRLKPCPTHETVSVLNKILERKVECIPYAIFWKHSEMWNMAHNVYHPNGILWNDMGLFILFKSFKEACASAVKCLVDEETVAR